MTMSPEYESARSTGTRTAWAHTRPCGGRWMRTRPMPPSTNASRSSGTAVGGIAAARTWPHASSSAGWK